MTRTAVLGLGLIGGSAALALRARGWDRDPEARRGAEARGIDVAGSLAEAVAGTEVVLLAVPTDATPALLSRVAAASPTVLLTDCASLKREVVRAAEGLPAGARFVGGHPMAGSRRRGIEGADAGLFRGRPWILVRTRRSDERDLDLLGGLVASAGAVPVVLDAESHDAAMTRISHLPHAVACALAAAVSSAGIPDLDRLAGPGLLDATRLAEAPTALQMELALGDPTALAGALGDVSRELAGLAEALHRRDAAATRAFFERAAAARRAIRPPGGS